MATTTTHNKTMTPFGLSVSSLIFSLFKKHSVIKASVAMMCLGATPMVLALTGDASAPIQIQSDEVSVDNKAQQATYTGNVFITQGSIKIRANKVTIKAQKGRLNSADMYGSNAERAVFEQTTDKGERIKGKAKRIQLNQKTSVLTLTDQAELNDGTNTIISPSIRYNSKQQTIAAKRKKDERVKMTFLPPEPTEGSPTPNNTGN